MRGLGLLIYGIEGIGKTSFALQAPKPLGCISLKEEGYDDLDMVDEVPEGCSALDCKNWLDINIAINAFTGKTLVIDSVSGLQQMLVAHITAEEYGGSAKAFGAYYNGLRQDCPRYMADFCDLLAYKRAQGTNIIVIAHRQTESEDNPGGTNTKVQDVFGDIGITGPLKKWAQAILFLDGIKQIDEVTKMQGKGDSSKVLEGKSFGKPARMMYTSYTGFHVAKNKLKLPRFISMGESAPEAWQNFHKSLPEKIRLNLGN